MKTSTPNLETPYGVSIRNVALGWAVAFVGQGPLGRCDLMEPPPKPGERIYQLDFEPDDWVVTFDISAVAVDAGVSVATIRRWLRAGEIPRPIYRRNRTLFWSVEDMPEIKTRAQLGVSRSINESPVESNSTGPDVTPSNENESI
jgi:hypothetical protein